MIDEYSKVKTLVEREGYPAGTIGIVVSLYSTGPASEVEIQNENGEPVDVVTYKLDELELDKS